MKNNGHLTKAKRLKNDEFFTQMETIDKELKYYKEHLEDKIVYCNCDDYRISNFFTYLKEHFHEFGLALLVSTNYSEVGESFKAIFNGKETKVIKIENGDFRSGISVGILKEVDVIITNPPFSLFKEHIKQLVEYEKDFIVLGNLNAVTYADIFPHIRDGVIRTGANFNVAEEFAVPEHYKDIVKTVERDDGKLISKISNIAWYTSFKLDEKEKLDLTEKFSETNYIKYDNYDAIEVSKVKNIPKDYSGIMGVPVNFLANYNPKQFKIVGSNRGRKQDKSGYYGRSTYINGKETYKRVFIKSIDE